MTEDNTKQMTFKEKTKFYRQFKYAIYAYAIVEFAVIAIAVYYKIYH